MCSDSSLLLLQTSAQNSAHGSDRIAPPLVAQLSCRQWRERPAHAALRTFLLTSICIFILLTVACGGKRPVTRTIPPPPSPQQKPEVASKPHPEKQIPETEQGKENEEKTANADEDEFAEYKDNKPIWTQTGDASWYGPPYHNRRGANGQVYDQNAMTAAHKSLPMGSIVRVTNLKTNAQSIVRITDRGPFIGDRIIDLSLAAAKALDVWRAGIARVKLDVLYAPADIANGGRWCVQVGAFTEEDEALKLKEKLQRKYRTAKILEFAGPTGFWVRVRVLDDDKSRAQEVASIINVDQGGVFLVRLD
jgi:rare lipoprotein A